VPVLHFINSGLKVYKKKGRVPTGKIYSWKRSSCKYWYWSYTLGYTRWTQWPDAHPKTSASGKWPLFHNGILKIFAVKTRADKKGYKFNSEQTLKCFWILWRHPKKYQLLVEEAVRIALKRVVALMSSCWLTRIIPIRWSAARKGSRCIGGRQGWTFFSERCLPYYWIYKRSGVCKRLWTGGL